MIHFQSIPIGMHKVSSAVCSVKNVDDQVDVTQSDTQSVAVLEKPHLACK